MTKQEIRDAIMRLDYAYLINNETDPIRRQKVIDLYFDKVREDKEWEEIDQMPYHIWSRKLNEYWEREIRIWRLQNEQ